MNKWKEEKKANNLVLPSMRDLCSAPDLPLAAEPLNFTSSHQIHQWDGTKTLVWTWNQP